GRISPPPSNTLHSHWAQEPPPPQAEARKIPSPARVCSNLPPAGTLMVFSWLISISTLPLLTSFARAAKITTTSAKTTRVKTREARKISVMSHQFRFNGSGLNINAAERHKAKRHQTRRNKSDAKASQACGNI